MKNLYCKHLPETMKAALVRSYLYSGLKLSEVFELNKNLFSNMDEFKEYMDNVVTDDLVVKARNLSDINMISGGVELGHKNESYYESELEYGAITITRLEDLKGDELDIYKYGLSSK